MVVSDEKRKPTAPSSLPNGVPGPTNCSRNRATQITIATVTTTGRMANTPATK